VRIIISDKWDSMKTIALTLAVGAMLIVSARGQDFLNLDFESAYNLPGNPGSGEIVSITNALPSWTAYGGDVNIYYVSNYFLGSATLVTLESGGLALNGEFSVELSDAGSISQTGMVPVDAESLIFDAEGPAGPNHTIIYSGFSITLGGQALAYTLLSQATGYSVYGANIPDGLDGQIEGLTLACQGVGSGMVILDNVEFSPTSVPEPSEFALAGLGVILFCFARPRTEGNRRGVISR
jgi:hypothetical protein